ncbi:MAG: LptF/LptG family permease [Treponema sp.]|jgi:lipopolysaccharide export system permease protein|nr:LptF/LptG family permease [Treponema sp.]
MKSSFSKTIFFYIARELLFAFCICFLFFFFIFFVNQLLYMAREILAKRVPLYQVVLLVIYALPSIIAMASPFACLTGTLITIGRLSSDNEILVFLSSGLSYRDIFFPALIVGLLISLFSFFANDILLPAGVVQYSRLYRRILFSSPALELESNSVKYFRDQETVIVTGPVVDKTIRDILILDRTKEGERRVIIAKEAGLEDLGEGRLSINLKDAFVQLGKENLKLNYDYAATDSLQYIVSQEEITQSIYSVGPREMSSVDVRKEIRKKDVVLQEKMETEYEKLFTDAQVLEEALRDDNISMAFSLIPGWEQAVASINNQRKDRSLSLYWLEYYKKFSIPFGALSFVLVAVSIGLMTTKSGQTLGFVIGNCMAALYWALLLIGQEMGTRLGFSPFWSMWLPNALAISAGIVLLFVKVLFK